jgi:hypothetical protein
MTIGAQHAEVLQPMVVVYPVDVIKFDRKRLPHPFIDATNCTSLVEEALP